MKLNLNVYSYEREAMHLAIYSQGYWLLPTKIRIKYLFVCEHSTEISYPKKKVIQLTKMIYIMFTCA